MTKLRDDIRNVAIIAHVDHCKTTLVDETIENNPTPLMSVKSFKSVLWTQMTLKRSAGLLIPAKYVAVRTTVHVSISWTHQGHADFGGEVERAPSWFGEERVRAGHDRDDARGLVLDLLDRRAVLTDVAEQQRLRRRLDSCSAGARSTDRSTPCCPRCAAGSTRPARRAASARVEGRGGWLEAAGDDPRHRHCREVGVAVGQGHRDHADAVLEPLEVALPSNVRAYEV